MAIRSEAKTAEATRAASKPRKAVVAEKKAASGSKKSPSGGKPAHKPERGQPYHHGDLHEALLLAAKRVAEREGLNGLSLRAVAREAGVSHAAPAHHFGDATGLLSELAAIGFKQFSAALGEAASGAGTFEAAAQGRANAYVAFARDNPCLFQLMFRAERLDHDRPVLHEASKAAFSKLAALVGARRQEEIMPDHLTVPQAADIARIWSLMHGFAMLHLDGQLKHILEASPPGTTEETLLAEMLRGR